MSNNLKIFFIAFFVSLPFFWGINFFQGNLENFFYAQISQPFRKTVFVNIPPKPKRPKLNLQAKSAISIKINSTQRQKILFKKEVEKKLPIASLTKLMTSLIVLEQNYDLKKTEVIISAEAANQENAPIYGNLDYKIGRKFKVGELLNLMLIYSSNDAAQALSEIMGTENFVEKMNQKARELKLKNTYFVNPHGLDPQDLDYKLETLENFNHSTSKDLVKLSQYILQEHPLIFKITKKEPEHKIKNGIFDLFLTQEVIGGKTGYTEEAGGSMIFLFEDKKGNIFINVILGTESAEDRVKEMQKLVDWLNKEMIN